MESNGNANIYEKVESYWRCANYLTVAQLYLDDNILLKKELKSYHLKSKVVGHWGTAPSVNFIYAHLNRFIQDHNVMISLVVGPGHSSAAMLSNLYLEGSLTRIDEKLIYGEEGVKVLCNKFGRANGFSTEIMPPIPGSGLIHCGGELGGAFGVAQGYAIENNRSWTVCIIGDGEFETSIASAAFQNYRYVASLHNRPVLPIIQLNGYKMSCQSNLSRMNRIEISNLMKGFGFEVIFVTPDHRSMWEALEHTWESSTENMFFPMIILDMPKGYTGPDSIRGHKFMGEVASHKAPGVIGDDRSEMIGFVKNWLQSYRPENLFTNVGNPSDSVVKNLPIKGRRIGDTPFEVLAGYKKLDLPQVSEAEDLTPAALVCNYLDKILQLNDQRRKFLVFSPDELDSNSMGMLASKWGRCDGKNKDGHVLEILNEHLCQLWLQGYLMSGGHGVFITYECFIGVVGSLLVQYSKMLSKRREYFSDCRVSSLNIAITSSAWRNNYSHQNPDIAVILGTRYFDGLRLYFPPDGHTAKVCLDRSFKTFNRVNIISFGKTKIPTLDLTIEDRFTLVDQGIIKLNNMQDESMPDLVLASSGDYVTKELLCAYESLRGMRPDLNISVVIVCEITRLAIQGQCSHGLSDKEFELYFPNDVPVIFSFNGYPSCIQSYLQSRHQGDRFRVLGYQDKSFGESLEEILDANEVSHKYIIRHALSLFP